MDIVMRNYIAAADYGEVYRLFTDFSVNRFIICKPDHNSMGVFAKWLDGKIEREFNDFMVFYTVADEFIGFAYSYEFQPLNGHCLFTVAVKEKFQNTGFGGFISVKFLKYLFENYNLRKVYTHVYSSNEHSLQCVEAFGFSKEGVLREYKFLSGKFDDLVILSLKREEFVAKISELCSVK